MRASKDYTTLASQTAAGTSDSDILCVVPFVIDAVSGLVKPMLKSNVLIRIMIIIDVLAIFFRSHQFQA